MRRAISAVSALAVAAMLPFVATQADAKPAHSSPAAGVKGSDGKTRADNRTSPLATQRASLRQRAVDALATGDARLKGKGKDRTIQMADGVEVDYPASQSADLLTFLVDFGNDPTGVANPEYPTAGPLNNEIPTPAASDNTTYWKADFNRQHYLDMFFNGMPEQDNESFKDAYDEMSSGRFDLEGDVSDWVTVDHPESYYSTATGDEDQTAMTNFIGDSANAWYDAALNDMSDTEIKAYLAQYDQWDRYDMDGDGDYNEPDGYIDHFQAVHAGEGEEAGAPEWTIWSHRWSANIAGFGTDGPAEGSCDACFPVGGVEIGNTGYYIYDYTTEPENGGLGVFAHEFGHDLGLPDYYDTGDGDNSNGYWTLMDSGSWLGHGQSSIGSSLGHMGPTEKLFLGWYGAETPDGFDDLAVADGTASTPQEVTLGPSYHATTVGKQAVLVNLPDGQASATGPAATGDYLYSGTRDGTAAQATGPTIALPAGSPTVTASVRYSIETDFDYAYLQVSDDDGATWTNVQTNRSTNTNPNGANTGWGITGTTSGAYVPLTADLTAYATKNVKLRWNYVTDANTHGSGLLVDSLAVGPYTTDFSNPSDWTLSGFYSVIAGQYQYDYSQYYMAENRHFDGYDTTLKQGPYSFDYANSAPNKVDHYSYQDGLLVWYTNTAYGDNNTSEHPGYGANLPVDANPGVLKWTGDGATTAANGRLQSFDSTFDVDQTDAVSLTKETAGGTQSVTVPAHASVPVFEDSNPDAYWSNDPDGKGWFSTKVSGVGTEIQVLSSDEAAGKMVVKIGKKFVAALGSAALSGTAQTGQTLTANASWFQSGVTTTATWLRDGAPIAGATNAATYKVQAADVGHTISAVVTGAKDGYTSTTLTTAGLPATQAGAPTATAAPKISGPARVGGTLKVTGAAWSVDGTSTYAWSVGGKSVGTGTSYKVKPADAGKKVTVTETFTAPGYAAATATAQSATIAKAKVSLKVSVGKAKKGKKVTATIKALSPDLTVPGKVKITYGGKSVGAKVLKNGKVTVKLPAKKKGSYKLKVSYLGATGFGTTSKTVTVKVK
jgi:immune inhibitor A